MPSLVPIALGAYQIIDSSIKGSQLKDQAEGVLRNRPIKQTSQYLLDNQTLQQSELANGMSAAAEKSYNDSVDRSLASTISALLKSGGSVNNIGDVYSATEQGRQNLAMIQDQLRLNHIAGVLKSQEQLAAEDEKNWLVNEYGPYKDKLQAIGVQRQNAEQQKVAGINTAGNGLMSLIGGDNKLNERNPPAPQNTPAASLSGNGYGTPAVPVSSVSMPMLTSLQPNQNNFLDLPQSNDAWANFWNTYQFKI